MALIGNLQQIFKNAAPQELRAPAELSGTQSAKALEKSGFAAKANGPTESFGNMVERFVNEVDGKMSVAQTEQQKVLTGESQNLHQAMLSMQEASVSFSLMVEVRNKLVESYQELMRMQL